MIKKIIKIGNNKNNNKINSKRYGNIKEGTDVHDCYIKNTELKYNPNDEQYINASLFIQNIISHYIK